MWVHSENLISATSSGFTQCTFRKASTPWGKGAVVRLSLVQLPPDFLQRRLIESAAGLADMNEFLILVIQAQHNRSEILPGCLRDRYIRR